MAKPTLMRLSKLAATGIAMATLLVAGDGHANPARLRSGAAGALCRKCHKQFEARLKRKVVHKPLRKGECTGCHNPHAASHKSLLKSDRQHVCDECHQVLKPKAVSTHSPAAQKRCQRCHDPHASDHAGLLISAQKALCAECHATVVKDAMQAKFGHAPLRQKGCTACHAAHSSGERHLLTTGQPKLCIGCHKPSRGRFKSRHKGFPVEKQACTGCHNPHGSDRPGMLRAHTHGPVLKGNCTECHVGLRGKNPLALREEGSKLCQSCHAPFVKAMMKRSHVHSAAFGPKGCLNCHTPHGSKRAKMLRGNMQQTCGKCHADTMDRFAKSPSKHTPVRNDCQKCHDPHGAESPTLLKNSNIIELCGSCHQWRKHSSHKVGDRYKDQRNPNLRIDCLSCHLGHGTEFKNMIPFNSTAVLCRECHRNMSR